MHQPPNYIWECEDENCGETLDGHHDESLIPPKVDCPNCGKRMIGRAIKKSGPVVGDFEKKY